MTYLFCSHSLDQGIVHLCDFVLVKLHGNEVLM